MELNIIYLIATIFICLIGFVTIFLTLYEFFLIGDRRFRFYIIGMIFLEISILAFLLRYILMPPLTFLESILLWYLLDIATLMAMFSFLKGTKNLGEEKIHFQKYNKTYNFLIFSVITVSIYEIIYTPIGLSILEDFHDILSFISVLFYLILLTIVLYLFLKYREEFEGVFKKISTLYFFVIILYILGGVILTQTLQPIIFGDVTYTDLSTTRTTFSVIGTFIIYLPIFITYLSVSNFRELHLIDLEVDRKTKTLREMNKEIKESEKEFRTLFDSVNDAIFIHDFEGNFLEVNKTACERLGYKKEKLLKMTPKDIDTPKYAKEFNKKIDELKKKKSLFFETVHITKEGREIPTEINSKVIVYQGKKSILSLARDISKRKESEKRFQDLFENANDLIQSVDTDYNFLYVNKKWKKSLGYTQEEIKNLKLTDIIAPKSKNLCEKILKRVKAGETIEKIDFTFLTKEGKEIIVEGNITPRIKNSKIKSIRAIFRDITERRELELKLSDAFLELEKLDQMKKDFLSMVTHEYRTPLTVIQAYSQLLEKEIPTKGSKLKSIQTAVDHLNEITNKLLDVSRIEREKMVLDRIKFNLSKSLNELITSNISVCDKNHEYKIDIENNVFVEADDVLIKSTTLNLLSNAHKYTPEDGNIEIKLFQNKNEIYFEIKDNGVGISKEDQKHLFEPFYIADKGFQREANRLGVGLFTSKKIIELHNGTMGFESEKGVGSKFYFTLPKYN